MPRIPQNYADTRLGGGAVSPEANPLAFNKAAGIGQLGGALADSGEMVSRIAHQKQLDDDYKWIVDASHQYHLDAANFENDSKNNTREDFGQATLDYLEQRKAEFLAQAPSKRAATRLKASLDNVVEQRYERARNLGEATKQNNALTGLDNGIRDLMLAYRQDAANDPGYAAGNLEPQIDLLKESIRNRWGSTVPKVGERLLTKLEHDFIVGTAEYDSAFARKLLDEADHLDESQRATLLNHIEAQEKSSNRLLRDEFSHAVEESLKLGKRTNGIVADIPAKAFENAYGKEAGALAKQQFDRERKEINRVSGFLEGVAGMNPGALSQKFSDFVGSKDVSDSAKVDAGVAIRDMMRLAQTDPHGYLTQHNREVSKAYEFAQALPVEQRIAGMERANRIALEYQGYAPVGAPASEQAKYLNLPTNARHLMNKAQAAAMVQKITAGAPSEWLSAIDDTMALYPKEQRAIAFGDMVTLPPQGDGLPQGIQWAFLHRDKTWVKDFIGAQTQDGIKSLTPEHKKKFEDALFSDPHWNNFAQTLLGDSAQRANEIAGFQEGLLNYAYFLSLKGAKSPEKAVSEASNRLINSAIAYPKVNGLPVPLMRQRENGSVWQDDEVGDLSRRLGVALETIPPEMVNKTDPNGRDIFTIFAKEIGDKPLNDVLPSIIRRHGFYVTRPDGHGATVYLSDDSGVAFQITNKQGQPWEVEFSELPGFYDMRFEGYPPYKQAPSELYVMPDLPTAYPIRPDKTGDTVRQAQQFWKNLRVNVPQRGTYPVP